MSAAALRRRPTHMFITLEGIEGSGKSTLLDALARRLRDAGRDVLTTREPGGTPVGDAIREVVLHKRDLDVSPLAEALLMNASRAALVERVIRPALAAGRIVLCDRYDDSSMAYQGYGRGLDLRMLRGICDAATGGLQPDLTLLLDISPEVSRERVSGRGTENRLDGETLEFYRRARQGFLTMASTQKRWRVFDGLQGARELADAAATAVFEELGARS